MRCSMILPLTNANSGEMPVFKAESPVGEPSIEAAGARWYCPQLQEAPARYQDRKESVPLANH
jgi:hypothetical protein